MLYSKRVPNHGRVGKAMRRRQEVGGRREEDLETTVLYSKRVPNQRRVGKKYRFVGSCGRDAIKPGQAPSQEDLDAGARD